MGIISKIRGLRRPPRVETRVIAEPELVLAMAEMRGENIVVSERSLSNPSHIEVMENFVEAARTVYIAEHRGEELLLANMTSYRSSKDRG